MLDYFRSVFVIAKALKSPRQKKALCLSVRRMPASILTSKSRFIITDLNPNLSEFNSLQI